LSAVSTAAGPAAVNSCEPILAPIVSGGPAPASRSRSPSASFSVSTSRATQSRSGIGVVFLQAQHLVLALEQRLDGADGRLRAVDREVIGDVEAHDRRRAGGQDRKSTRLNSSHVAIS